jgi:hypothetical protein
LLPGTFGIGTNTFGIQRLSFSHPVGQPFAYEVGDVVGCGIILDDAISIFYTKNGNLLRQFFPTYTYTYLILKYQFKEAPIAIRPTVDRLFPTMQFCEFGFEANFGNDSTKPFVFDYNGIN